MEIFQAHSPAEVASARELFEEYALWLGIDLCFQNFERELAELPGDYAPPSGRLFLARQEGDYAGCVALRRLDEGICEMKRLFVRPSYRSQGLGRILTEALIDESQRIGYNRIRLDTLPGRMDRAIAMYESLGFQQIPAYYHNPAEAVMFMELMLEERVGRLAEDANL